MYADILNFKVGATSKPLDVYCQLYLTYRTANLQSFILYIYSTNIGTENFKHCVYCPFFSLFKMLFVS